MSDLENYDHDTVMQTAFSLVCDRHDWKALINFTLPLQEWRQRLAVLGVTQDEVLESIRYYTATGSTVMISDGQITITAPGYRAGPAGDH